MDTKQSNRFVILPYVSCANSVRLPKCQRAGLHLPARDMQQHRNIRGLRGDDLITKSACAYYYANACCAVMFNITRTSPAGHGGASAVYLVTYQPSHKYKVHEWDCEWEVGKVRFSVPPCIAKSEKYKSFFGVKKI